MSRIRRIYVEKKEGFSSAAETLLKDLRENLGIKGLTGLRILKRYDISGITENEYRMVRSTILSEPPVDRAYDEEFPMGEDETVIAVEYLPGQYDQRADSAAQCIRIITLKQKPVIAAAEIIVLQGTVPGGQLNKIKKYLVNPVDSREAVLEKPDTLQIEAAVPPDVEIVEGFITQSEAQLEKFRKSRGLAMSKEDLLFCREYFKDQEKRDPTITEIKLLDTYWSDHCRHTTFTTRIETVEIKPSRFSIPIENAYQKYLDAVKELYPGGKYRGRDVSLMNIATMSMKEMRAKGKLDDMEVSGEVNACSIVRDVEVNGKKEKWLVMFKNETHNHPTEIEPFGGAATCLGGAIRDPLSGRSYVYQAMRVTGSGNPCGSIEDTLPGKLPQRKITTEAAHGYSSYGNQIGLLTGLVTEIYDQGYIAKRMEVGAVIAAVPQKNVIREEPQPGDVILLAGGRTGRDGIGGATGSSKEHTEDSIHTAGAEVQKGNAPEERKLQRLFRNPEVTRMIKKSNDFGAGGVSVAIGELADGLEINLDAVPRKYDGLDGTELALSESQERMAVVVAPGDVGKFKTLAALENLEATEIAWVTPDNRLKMSWRNKTIVDIGRSFIDSNGIQQATDIVVTAPVEKNNFFNRELPFQDLKTAWLDNLKDLNTCSQKGLGERFDSNVGAGSVLMPFGGKYQLTPTEAMAAKIPVISGDTTGGTLMSFGFNPAISRWSPFHGAAYAVVEAAAKITAVGGDYSSIRMSLQEYFEKLGKDPERWGKPFSALLGAYHALTELEIAAIGGKDSMSGSFMDLDVPPTLIAFAVDTVDVNHVISPEFKKAGNTVVYVKLERDEYELPRFDLLKKNYSVITEKIKQGKIVSAHTVRHGGIAAAISKMSFGNKTGFSFDASFDFQSLFSPDYGSIILEIEGSPEEIFEDLDYCVLGYTATEPVIKIKDMEIAVDEALAAWEAPLERVFPTRIPTPGSIIETPVYTRRAVGGPAVKVARPRVVITAFPGTNSEYDSQKAFERAGAVAETVVFRNLTTSAINQSVEELRKKIDNAQIVMIPGGFSAGDEPDGSGKFIAAVFRNPYIREAVTGLLKKRDGLMLGICNGFQALVKLGLLPYGEIRDIEEGSPTVTFNRIGRHVSCMARTKVVSVLSPWFLRSEVGAVHMMVFSHGEGRFVANEAVMKRLIESGQVAVQYVDMEGKPTMALPYNPNGSMNGVEGITSPDGRILGKMGHSERMGTNVSKNVPGNKNQQLFESGVEYFG
ncbi:MAG: phosphoribosylformylglycinamidine synthase [bacterium]|nr:phosphoribosylformylglycinamidine synthase [bacterium]